MIDYEAKIYTIDGYVEAFSVGVARQTFDVWAYTDWLPVITKVQLVECIGLQEVYQLKATKTKKLIASGDVKVFTYDGKKKVKDLKDGDIVLTYDAHGFIYQPLTKVQKLERKRKLLRIQTKDNAPFIVNGIVVTT